MIKRKEITAYNFDNYILQERRKRIKWAGFVFEHKFYWDKKEWNMFTRVYNSLGMEAKEGVLFMGAKHYRLKV